MPATSGAIASVPRPRARWLTRVFVPLAVLLAACGILAYAARDALQPRLDVHVVAAIPKSGVVLASDAAGHTAGDEARPAADAPPGPVTVQAPGWIEPAPFAVSVPALAEGVVREVLVLEGERIEAGQVVARLIDDDAKLALRAAEAAVAARRSDVERARAAVATAESQVQMERIAVEELRDEVSRKRDLVAVGGVPAGDFRRLEIRLTGLEAKVVVAGNLVSEARAALAQAETELEAATITRDEAALQLSRMEVRSPAAGVVLSRLVEPGSRISMGGKGKDLSAGDMTGAVLRVYDPAKLQVRVDVSLADAAKVSIGTRATVSTEALPDQSFVGVVTRVIHEANIQRNTVQFKVALDTSSPFLKPEMLTRVKLHAPAAAAQRRGSNNAISPMSEEVGGGDMILLVPTDTITFIGADKGQVWVVDASGGSPVARRRDIATAASSDEGFTAVTSGLRLTDRIILDLPAPPAIKDGVRIRVLGERAGTVSGDPSKPEPATP